ncbi:caspase family protein [Streptomyces katrae]|uniref:caspase family protein n=1 Tax=Streptomyces katrae TaxID=68223 RepID=UPI0004BEE543|nr:caspase family protein [Streptomyces katrae]
MSGPSFPSFGSARAVLIGAASYTSRDLTPIPHSARNIRGLEAALTDGALGGFATDDVRLVDDPDKPRDIMEPVWAAAEEAEDVLLVYYSGHGLIAGATGDLHLSMTESEPGQDWTSLRFSYLAGVVKQSRADVKIVILDSCFSGLAHSDLMGADSRLITDQLAAVRGVYSLTSAPGDRRSKAPAGARYSAFTGFLLGAMQEGVQGAGPLLGANDLYNEVLRRMRDTGLPLPEECGKTGAGDFPPYATGPSHRRPRSRSQSQSRFRYRSPGTAPRASRFPGPPLLPEGPPSPPSRAPATASETSTPAWRKSLPRWPTPTSGRRQPLPISGPSPAGSTTGTTSPR